MFIIKIFYGSNAYKSLHLFLSVSARALATFGRLLRLDFQVEHQCRIIRQVAIIVPWTINTHLVSIIKCYRTRNWRRAHLGIRSDSISFTKNQIVRGRIPCRAIVTVYDGIRPFTSCYPDRIGPRDSIALYGKHGCAQARPCDSTICARGE